MKTNEIKEAILTALPNAIVLVDDPYQDGEHFQAIVVDESFENMSLIKQHQIIMKSLTTKFETSVHALQLKTMKPSVWETEKHQYLK